MKRSNRLVLLIGVFLAIVAFVGVIVLSGGGGNGGVRRRRLSKARSSSRRLTSRSPRRSERTRSPSRPLALTAILPGRLHGRLPGHRQGRPPDGRPPAQQITGDTLRPVRRLDPRHRYARRTSDRSRSKWTRSRASGRSSRPRDYVDMVVGFASDKFPVVTQNPVDDSFQVVAGLNGTSVKLLLQGMQVLGTLLPVPRPRLATRMPARHRARPSTTSGDRHPGGHPAAGGSHQVRPAGWIHLPGPALGRRLHRSGRPARSSPSSSRAPPPASSSRRSSSPTASCRRNSSRRSPRSDRQPTGTPVGRSDPGRGNARADPGPDRRRDPRDRTDHRTHTPTPEERDGRPDPRPHRR